MPTWVCHLGKVAPNSGESFIPPRFLQRNRSAFGCSVPPKRTRKRQASCGGAWQCTRNYASNNAHRSHRSKPQRVVAGGREEKRNQPKKQRDTTIIILLADRLGCSEHRAAERLQQLLKVLPALDSRDEFLGNIGVEGLAKYCDDIPGLVRRLVHLKNLFPTCDVDILACGNPFLLTDDLSNVSSGLDTLNKELFPFAGEKGTPGVDRMAQAVPQLLDPSFAKAALTRLECTFGSEAADMVHRNPLLVLQVESRTLRSRYSKAFDQINNNT
eukprot:8017266-Pyramimonas_sp.AAC.1